MRLLISLAAILWFAPAAFAEIADKVPAFDGLMTDSIDRSIDPCDDFYQYACHGWLAHNPIPADESSWDVGAPLVERNNENLRKILEHAAAAPAADNQRIGDYWKACMDEAAIERRGLNDLQPELDIISKLTRKADLAPLLAHLHKIGVDAFFTIGSSQDYRDATRVIAEIDQGGLGLPDQSYYSQNDTPSQQLRTAYHRHLAQIGVLSGLSSAIAVKDADAAYRIEARLARASLSDEQRVDPRETYHLTDKKALHGLFAGFNWDAYFKALGIPSVDKLNVAVPSFVSSLQTTDQGAALDDIKSYLRLRLIEHASDMLPSAFGEEDFQFFGAQLRGTKVRKPRWKRCVAAVDQDLGEDLGKIYVRAVFGPDAKVGIRLLVKNLRSAFAEDLQTVPWMGDVTRLKAVKKLDAMVEKIGYPDKWRDYSGLTVKPDDALGNLFRSAAFDMTRQLDKIGKPVDREEWEMTPPTVNAYYDDQKNDINFPAGTLQPPYFDLSWSDAINYGSIGATIGHEMTHGFDNSGRMFDEAGNLRSWWTPKDADNFETRARCLVSEYSGFTVADGVNLNGRTTLGENTADNGGTRLAYRALEKALDGKPTATIDGYTPEQRFFLAYAQSFCENQTEAGAKLQAQTDPHSTASYRVNGVVQNMLEFRRAFACKEGQKMAPAKICRVW